jgi:hypothetical protein
MTDPVGGAEGLGSRRGGPEQFAVSVPILGFLVVLTKDVLR